MSTATLELRPSTTRVSDEERVKRMENPGFGRVFTEHMVLASYLEGRGWDRAVLQPYAPISLDPSASVLHYGQAIFEGFKAYRYPDGSIWTFRPDQNGHRFNSSARRLAMPEYPVERFIEAADAVIRFDREWVPDRVGEALYIRPAMIATETALGVKPSKSYLFMLFASPAGSYFQGGIKPVSVWISEKYVRASPGGTGAAKFAGNYGASLAGQKEAISNDCEQVVWLDAVHREFVEEMGGMNICFVFQEKGRPVLVTPELTGTLLAGITRASLIQLCQEQGLEVQERRVSVNEWREGLQSGAITEVFACGTAAVITPIGLAKYRDESWVINDGKMGPVATQLRETLLDIQQGRVVDTHGWMHRVC